ncbi:transporter substrate-binding domain-containing protein [Halomonas salipaludis]|uniref:Nickel transporter n=1 Tax=Halomonas salipaludis TaxID=2032625 RepID=A0A2A2EWX7_9GAMM|nr:transporter substrate-binding domain-containing protein [Halomonas salipaludis]PAU76862.1 nickel transporter [Halomonas salipaludis]
MMKNKFKYSVAILAIGFSANSYSQDLPDPLVIATEGAYPPFNYVDASGNVLGFEVDLARAMCEELKANCQFVTQDWDGIIPGLLARHYDAVVGSLYITDERKERIAFSEKYYQTPTRFVVMSDSDVEISDEGISRITIGTQRGTSFERMMRDEHPDADLRVYGSIDEAYQDLQSGRVDAVIDDVVSINENLLSQEHGGGYEMRGPEFSDPEWFGYGAGVGVHKDDKYIADAFSEAIRTIRENGTYERISNEWFGFDVYGEQ